MKSNNAQSRSRLLRLIYHNLGFLARGFSLLVSFFHILFFEFSDEKLHFLTPNPSPTNLIVGTPLTMTQK